MNCFICGGAPHAPYASHEFWSVDAAFAEAHAYDARAQAAQPSMSAVETLDPREAVYA